MGKNLQILTIFGLFYGSFAFGITLSFFNRKIEQEPGILHEKVVYGFQGETSDEAALDYCKNHKNVYLAIIWPRAFDHRALIKKALSRLGALLYQKNFSLLNNGPSLFFQIIHPEIFHGNLQPRLEGKYEKFLKNYIPSSMPMPYKFCAILFESSLPISDIQRCKYAIRNVLKMSFFSVHINDSYQEALAAAQIVFNDELIAHISLA